MKLSDIKIYNDEPFRTLGLTSSASKEDVEEAYEKLALVAEPDKNPDNKELAAEILNKLELIKEKALEEVKVNADEDVREAMQGMLGMALAAGNSGENFIFSSTSLGGAFTSQGSSEEVTSDLEQHIKGQQEKLRSIRESSDLKP